MDKNLIKSLILEKQQILPNIEITQRQIALEDAGNYVFVGLRRAGKTYLMYQHIQNLISSKKIKIENVLFINFEDERLTGLKVEDLNLFLECYNELYDLKPIIFLDEIQNIAGWEKFVRRLADSKYKVFVTGSNAEMLSKEIYTTLGGRFLVKKVNTFSLQEYLDFHRVTLGDDWEYDSVATANIVRLFQDYFYYGGFAELFLMKDKRSWITLLYQKILLNDVVLHNSIRNENAIRLLVKKLSESVMQLQSVNRLKNVITSTGVTFSHNTLIDYLRFLEDAYLIFGIPNFLDKFSNKETIKKRYFGDNGLLNNFLVNPETKLLENLVAISLQKKYDVDLYYYKRNVEVDFYIPADKRAIQVSYSLSDDATKKREVAALLKLAEAFQLDSLEIVTFNEEETICEGDKVIQVIPIWKWELRNSD